MPNLSKLNLKFLTGGKVMQNQYKYTMVSTLGTIQNKKKEYQGFMLVDSDYRSMVVSAEDVVKALTKDPGCISNMEIRDGKPVSSNGALDRYAFGDRITGQYIGVANYVVINRIEENGNLWGYTMYAPNGTIQRVDNNNAVALAKQKLISNGKIRTSAKGTEFVSSIRGDYNVIDVSTKKQKKPEKVTLQLMFTTMNGNTGVQYTGMIVKCVDMERLSQIITGCREANAALIQAILPYGGKKAARELQIIPMAESTHYVVIDNKSLDAISKMDGVEVKVTNRFTVSYMNYKQDGSGDFFYAESPVRINNGQMEVGKPTIDEDNKSIAEKLESNVKNYGNAIKNWYNGLAHK